MKKFVMWVVLAGIAIAAGNAEIPKDTVNALKTSLMKRQLMPRGLSAEQEVHWAWNGNQLALTPPKVKTLGVLVIDFVSARGDVIEIAGNRRTLLRKNTTEFSLSAAEERETIMIDLKGADIKNVMPHLAEMVFYPDGGAAMADVPELFKPFVPADTSKDCCGPSIETKFAACDCAKPDMATCGSSVPRQGMVGIGPPKINMDGAEDPTDERGVPVSGNIELGLNVNQNGHLDDFWILRPGSPKLAEKIIRAAKDYRFSPATCHGKPISLAFDVDMGFSFSGPIR